MNEDEFFYEEDAPSRTRIICLILLLIFTVAIVSFIVYRRSHTLNIRENLVFELGSTVPTNIDAYLNNKIFDERHYKINLKKVPITDNKFSTVGKYEFKISYNKLSKKGTLEVKDTQAPIVEVQSLTIGVDEEYVVDDFIVSLEEYSLPCTVSYKNEKDETLQKKAGTYNFDIIIADPYGNSTTKNVKLNVTKEGDLTKTKRHDMQVSYIEPNYDDWDNTFFVKGNEAMTHDELEKDEDFAFLYEYTDDNYANYLPLEYQGMGISHVEIIYAYNKWHYIIGVVVRVQMSNGAIVYLEK